MSASYADVDGEVTDWPLTADAVRDTLIDAMYDRVGRMLTLRALTAAEAGDWVPLARMVYSGSGPFVISNNASDFTYYATSCADRFVDGPDTDAAEYLAWLARSPFATSPAGSVYLSSAACHAWPLPPGATPTGRCPQRGRLPGAHPGSDGRPDHAGGPRAADLRPLSLDRRHVPGRDPRRSARDVRARVGLPRRPRDRPPDPRDATVATAHVVPRRHRRPVPRIPG